MSKLFFIIGNPRSGTTLFRLMLNNHPNISIPPECGFALWWYKKYANSDFSEQTVIDKFLDDLAVTKKFETWLVDLSELRAFLIQSCPVSYQDIVQLVYLFYARSTGRTPDWLGDKNNFYTQYLPQIKELLPDSKLIFIVRDGRDVACSYKVLANKKIDSKYAPKLSGVIKEIADEWVRNNFLIKQEIENGAFFLRYEDLLRSPDIELGRVCHYLGLNYDDEMLNYYKQGNEPAEFLQWKEKTLQQPDTNNIGKFRNILTKSEIDDFESIAGELLGYFQYL